MSDMRPRGIPIMLDGVERHILFTLNAIDELQDRYGKNLFEILKDLANEDTSLHLLRDILTVLLNREAERARRLDIGEFPTLTEEDVGELIGMDNYYEILSAIFRAYGISMPEPDEADPNRTGGQRT